MEQNYFKRICKRTDIVIGGKIICVNKYFHKENESLQDYFTRKHKGKIFKTVNRKIQLLKYGKLACKWFLRCVKQLLKT